MTVSLTEFLELNNEIRDEEPVYDNGGTGADGTCDCIGMIMGAMYRAGQSKYALHSTNYFARSQTVDPIDNLTVDDLIVGMVVYKYRNSRESGYNLPIRNQVGGRDYNGDLRDYYHVGVVMSISPLVIMHCTSSGGVNGITTDSKLGQWKYGGKLKHVDYDDYDESEATIVGLAGKTCTVVSDGALNLRKTANKSGTRIMQIPEGEQVYCYTDTGTWAKVKYDANEKSNVGYVMSKYLDEAEDQDGDTGETDETNSADEDGTVTLHLTAEEAETLKSILQKL